MKSSAISLALILAICAYTAWGLTFTPQEQIAVNELLEHRDALRISFANSFFGTSLSPQPKAELTCTLCRSLLLIVLNWIHEGLSDQQISYNIKSLCKSLDIANPEVCDGAVDEYIDIALYIVKERPWLNRFDVCGMIMGGSIDADCRNVNESMLSWKIDIAGNKPPVVEHPLLPENIPTAKVVHLTDIHPDLRYKTGSLADCGSFLCCRASENDDPSNTSISAGPWGDYRDCDIPIAGVEVIFNDAATRHSDAEFVMMTGDLTHHEIWNYSIEDNLAHYNSVFQLLKQEFKDKPIYPVVGNHEPVPSNLFPPSSVWDTKPEHNISWVYNTLADAFSSSLTTEAEATFRKAGFYTLLHSPGFRLIALNTNFCYTLNFWLIHSPQDPENQLQWLSDTLKKAEESNELVWILGHVPPGHDDCWYFWGEKYNQLVNRYEAIIKAQFYGHTHNDDLRVFFDMSVDPPRPTSSLYISTSVTPYSFVNPGYKVFYADGARGDDNTWEIVDHEAWIYNVTEANKGGASQKPTMFREYSAKEEFGLKSFRPADMYDLVVRMAKDDSLFQKFYRFYQMSYHDQEECSDVENCKLERLCALVQTDYTATNCNRIEGIMNGTISS